MSAPSAPDVRAGWLRSFSPRGYAAAEADLANWLVRAFPGEAWWRERILTALAPFLERPAGAEILLAQKHLVDTNEQPRTLAFRKSQIFIGRDEQCDVPIPVRAAAKRHACIEYRGGEMTIQDLGTALGTFVNKARLTPMNPHVLVSGDQVTIFPYSFEVSAKALWEPDATAAFRAGSAAQSTWTEFAAGAWDSVLLPVAILPAGARVCVGARQAFLDELCSALLRPLGVARPQLGLTEFDSGLIEFLSTAVLQASAAELGLTLELDPGPLTSARGAIDEGRGVAIPFSLNMLGIGGSFHLFVPYRAIAALQTLPLSALPEPVAPVSFRCPVVRGWVDLTAAELGGLEPLDVVLIEPEAALLFPGDPGRGWRISLEEGDNSGEARIENYFERGALGDNTNTPTAELATHEPRPDLRILPVRLHVIVAEKELTLAELNGLAAGSVLDLDLPQTGVVTLAVNGRAIGTGELVTVDGRLGVRISGWSTA